MFLTLGLFESTELELMLCLVGILSESPNRFIVSKGAAHDKNELPDNMWGQRFCRQRFYR